MLAESLRLIRVFHDVKQQELAERLELSKSYISELEKGRKVPSLEVVQKYSVEFGIPMSSILFFAENMNNPSKAARARNAIGGKVLKFLQFIETKTANDEA